MEQQQYPYYEQYFIRKKLLDYAKKEGFDNIKIFNSNLDLSYSDLSINKVFIPFNKKYTLQDFKTMLQHELLHFKLSKNIYDFGDQQLKIINNVIEDMYINKNINRSKLEQVYKKYSMSGFDKINRLFIWYHLTEEEKERLTDYLAKKGIIKEDGKEEFKKLIDELLEEREKYDDNYSFVNKNIDKLEKLLEFFIIPLPKEVGDGPCEPDKHYNLPNFDLLKSILKLIRKMKTYSEVVVEYKQFYGKKVNRKYIEDIQEIYPFRHKKTYININKPKITIILDSSGSMKGMPEERAKSFIVPVLQELDAVLIAHNDFKTVITRNPQMSIKIPMQGDERFDKLKEKLKEQNFEWPIKTDILICITDLVIDKEEAEGLQKLFNETKARKKYLLCVNDGEIENYKDIIKTTRISISDDQKMLNFVKKLTGQYQ